jgi:hypothetical protein
MGWLNTTGKWALGAIAGLGTGLLAAPGGTAERIEFFYGPVEIAIRVNDIQHFADTGEVQGSLRPVASQLTPAQRQGLRALLNRSFPLDVVTVSELAYSPVGVRLLEQLGPSRNRGALARGLHCLGGSGGNL